MKPGDLVRYLDEPVQGRVKEIHGDLVTVIRDDGFEETVPRRQLVAVGTTSLENNLHSTENKDIRGKSVPQPEKIRGGLFVELDLHAGALFASVKGRSSHNILLAQLQAARAFIEKHRGSGNRIILIHGVGEGRLRAELEVMLNGMERVTYQDASYGRYGRGATEVICF